MNVVMELALVKKNTYTMLTDIYEYVHIRIVVVSADRPTVVHTSSTVRIEPSEFFEKNRRNSHLFAVLIYSNKLFRCVIASTYS